METSGMDESSNGLCCPAVLRSISTPNPAKKCSSCSLMFIVHALFLIYPVLACSPIRLPIRSLPGDAPSFSLLFLSCSQNVEIRFQNSRLDSGNNSGYNQG